MKTDYGDKTRAMRAPKSKARARLEIELHFSEVHRTSHVAALLTLATGDDRRLAELSRAAQGAASGCSIGVGSVANWSARIYRLSVGSGFRPGICRPAFCAWM